MDKKNKYWQLFLSTFKLSACTFGGGFVIIPLMRERFVKELHWIEEEEMLDTAAADYHFHHFCFLPSISLQQVCEHGYGRYAGRCGGGHL